MRRRAAALRRRPLRRGCPPTDGCGPALPLACADGLCYAATATCAAVTTATPPRLAKHAALSVFVGGVAAAATTVPLHSASSEVARLTVPAGAFGSDALLLFAPVADSVLAEAQAPATWASWQSSIFSAVVGVDAAAGGATALASGRSLSVTLAATVPSTIAISDTCLGYLQQLDATRRVWRCAGVVSASATGADNEYLVSGSLDVVAPFAVIFSDTAEAAHPDYALPPPAGPPPPAVPEGTLALVVALFALFLLAVAAVVAACGLAAMGPIVVQRSTRVEPDAKGGGGGGGYGGGGYGGGGGRRSLVSKELPDILLLLRRLLRPVALPLRHSLLQPSPRLLALSLQLPLLGAAVAGPRQRRRCSWRRRRRVGGLGVGAANLGEDRVDVLFIAAASAAARRRLLLVPTLFLLLARRLRTASLLSGAAFVHLRRCRRRLPLLPRRVQILKQRLRRRWWCWR